jgi:hypothetical protein
MEFFYENEILKGHVMLHASSAMGNNNLWLNLTMLHKIRITQYIDSVSRLELYVNVKHKVSGTGTVCVLR